MSRLPFSLLSVHANFRDNDRSYALSGQSVPAFSPRVLERVLPGELEAPFLRSDGALATNLAEGRIRDSDVRIPIAHDVERVKSIEPELEFLLSENGEALEDRGIDVLETRAANGSVAGSA